MRFINSHKGFTLAELMVCLAIISVIATLLMPAINNLRPNKSKVMFKKAYYLAERIVSEMVNDEDLYPFVEDKVGFDNTAQITINGVNYGGDNKFCRLFAQKLNTLENNAEINCNGGASFDGNPSFTTTDGVEWILPISNFELADKENDYLPIMVDVNGSKMEPNCLDKVDPAETCPQPDRFTFEIRPDGKMRVSGYYAKQYVGSTNMIENKK